MSIIKAVLNHYQDHASYQNKGFNQTEAYKGTHKRMAQIEEQILKLAPGLSQSELHLLANDLLEAANDRLYEAESHGFNEGFRAAFRFQKELNLFVEDAQSEFIE